MKRTPSLPVMIALLAGLAAIGVATLTAWFQVSDKSETDTSMVLPTVKIGGPFELMDHTNKLVTQADFMNQYTLIYFGYTYCPDVCPTELTIMTTTLDELADKDPKLAEKITPIFITVDPKRDTVDVMAEYVDNFHPRMVGLTGNSSQTALAAKAYRVFYALGDPDEDGDYPVDHSSFLYFMGPGGAYRTMFKHNSNPLQVAKTLKSILEADGY